MENNSAEAKDSHESSLSIGGSTMESNLHFLRATLATEK